MSGFLRDLLSERSHDAPDVVIGGDQAPYLLRWYLVPWSRWCHEWRKLPPGKQRWWMRFVMSWPVIYLHLFLRSDDDRALHDHPWANCSYVLRGAYTEHTIDAGGINRRHIRNAGDVVFRRAKQAHRVELHAGPCQSLFFTGFRLRDWGFHCRDRWVRWQDFTNPADGGATVGKGCE